jgi:hypothetical protein
MPVFWAFCSIFDLPKNSSPAMPAINLHETGAIASRKQIFAHRLHLALIRCSGAGLAWIVLLETQAGPTARILP